MKKRTNQGRVETRDELVEQADFVRLFQSLMELNPNFVMPGPEFKALARAIGRKAAIDPTGMTSEALTLATAMTTYLLCRAQYATVSRIQASDQARRTKPGELSADVSDEWIPRLERIIRLLIELAQTQAKMAYLHGQAPAGGNSHDRRSGSEMDASEGQAFIPSSLAFTERGHQSETAA